MSVALPRSRWTRTVRGGAWIPAAPHLILHHSWRPDLAAATTTAVERSTTAGIRRYHVATNGWSDIAYPFLIFNSGRAYQGRGWNRSGAHTRGRNHDAMAFCFVIDGDRREPSPAAWRTARELAAEGVEVGGLRSDYRLSGHTDWSSKSCPGRATYPVMHKRMTEAGVYHLGDRVVGYTGGIITDQGDDVAEWQAILVALGFTVAVDGIFGPATDAATRQVQQLVGVPVDGLVGPNTLRATARYMNRYTDRPKGYDVLVYVHHGDSPDVLRAAATVLEQRVGAVTTDPREADRQVEAGLQLIACGPGAAASYPNAVQVVGTDRVDTEAKLAAAL